MSWLEAESERRRGDVELSYKMNDTLHTRLINRRDSRLLLMARNVKTMVSVCLCLGLGVCVRTRALDKLGTNFIKKKIEGCNHKRETRLERLY